MRRRVTGRTSYGVLSLSPATEADLLALVVRHGLVDVPTPGYVDNRPRAEQTVARWFETLAEDRTLCMMVDKSGDRWLITRDRTGMIEYAKIEGILRHMEREKAAGTVVGGETREQKRGRFQDWLKSQLGGG